MRRQLPLLDRGIIGFLQLSSAECQLPTPMNHVRPRKTVGGCTVQSLLKGAWMAHGALRTADKSGQVYTIERAPERTARVTRLGGGWAAVVALDAWCEGELAWWEAQLDASAQGRVVWVLVDEQDSVVGHLSDARWGAAPGRAHAFLVDNAARRPLPALGERYVPPAAPTRPKRTRGLAR